jgi:hypothetical protein
LRCSRKLSVSYAAYWCHRCAMARSAKGFWLALGNSDSSADFDPHKTQVISAACGACSAPRCGGGLWDHTRDQC